jgi:tetraacyldisaccharide-1-P 4'-kinase
MRMALLLASRIPFPDHHHYKAHDLDCIQEAARSTGATAFVITGKDRMRLGKFAAAFTAALQLKTAGLRIEIEDEAVAVDSLVQSIASL